jgi:hypothetical protein
MTALDLVGFDAISQRVVEQALGAAPLRERLHRGEETVGGAGLVGKLLHGALDMRRAQARGQERAPHRAGATKLPPVLVLGALGDLAPQLRPVRLERVDQCSDRVGRHRAIVEALRLPQRGPEFRRAGIGGQFGAWAFELGATTNLVIKILAATRDDAMHVRRQLNRAS